MTLQEACVELGLEFPVEIVITEDLGQGSYSQTDATYHFHRTPERLVRGVHRIKITPSALDKYPWLLWHELRHAQQAEELGVDNFGPVYNKHLAKFGYGSHPMELDAYTFMCERGDVPIEVPGA